MLISMVEFTLVLVTLVAAIVGTISNPSGRVKAGIIGLAVIASIGTYYKVLDTARKNDINEKLIITLVQASSQPEYFSHDLVKFINPLLEETGQVVSNQIVSEKSSERLLILKKESSDDSDISGVLFFSRKQMNPIFYEYAIEGDMTKPLREHLNQSWTNCDVHWNECFNELRGVGTQATEISPIKVDEYTAGLTTDLSFSLVSSETFRGTPIRIQLDRAFITDLYGLTPSERGVRILIEAQKQVIDQL